MPPHPLAETHPSASDDPSAPVVPAHVSVPEITVRSILLSVLLAAVLAAANAYLGLFAGMTVSASIPAAVLSMAILRWSRTANILENNIVQTAASSGEALAAGVIFTLPALVLLGAWDHFHYWDTVLIAGVGGTLGVLFTIPLRRALVGNRALRFPEGVATAEVLKAGMGVQREGASVRALLTGGLCGAAAKFGESGLRLWPDSIEQAAALGRTLWYGGLQLSPALVAVGYIIGLRTAAVVFGGGVLAWWVLLPFAAWVQGWDQAADALAATKMLWGTQLRSIGIGAMLVGGLWTLSQIRGPVIESLTHLTRTLRRGNRDSAGVATAPSSRLDRDAPGWFLAVLMAGCLLATVVAYDHATGSIGVAILMTLAMIPAAFLFSSVAGYMAGLVGSSSNPVSGVTIATLMLTATLLLLFLGAQHPAGPMAALLIAAVVCCAAAMGGDNLQDLKTGQLVGATPWKQQVMQLIGVGTAAIVLAPVLTVLHAQYGMGAPTTAHPHPLTAPQATLMANLATGMFNGGLPWGFVTIGAALAIILIACDRWLVARSSSWRLPVLAVALGLYLPLKLTAAVMVGGLISAACAQYTERRQDGGSAGPGVLAAAGLITGEALMGILLAAPLALTSIWPWMPAEPFALSLESPLGPWPGIAMLCGISWFLLRRGRS